MYLPMEIVSYLGVRFPQKPVFYINIQTVIINDIDNMYTLVLSSTSSGQKLISLPGLE